MKMANRGLLEVAKVPSLQSLPLSRKAIFTGGTDDSTKDSEIARCVPWQICPVSSLMDVTALLPVHMVGLKNVPRKSHRNISISVFV
jgi:hypothetical protein